MERPGVRVQVLLIGKPKGERLRGEGDKMRENLSQYSN
jgi:hypothetical protein